MNAYPIHTVETAPEGSKALLAGLQQGLGMLPSLAAGMAESPQLLAGFLAVREIYLQGTFSPAEIQVISLTAACENGCGWCMAFHSRMALQEGVSRADVDALRAGGPPAEPRLAALSTFARTMVQARGAASDADVERFCAAGYTRAQALEVVLGLAFSQMANYAGHLVDAPLDPPFVPHAWRKA